MSTHAILSPSAAHRWLACPPSARFEEQLPDTTSPYAEEGTLAHEFAALLLSVRAGLCKLSREAFHSRVKEFFKNELFSDEMEEYVNNYVNFVTDKEHTHILIEHKYDLSEYAPCSFGTADCTLFTKEVVHVIDLKYGSGVKVSATGNKQLMLYALGALKEAEKLGYNPSTVLLSIYQPRAGGVSTWETTKDDLLSWAETELTPRANLAIAGIGEFKTGEHCRFCKASAMCRAYYKEFASLKKIRDEREMSDEEVGEVLREGDGIASWVKKVVEASIEKLTAGGKIEGFKLVEGRGKRSFKSEDNVVEILLAEDLDSEDIFNSSLKSLTDLEKRLGKKRFEELFSEEIIRVAGKPTLAPNDDPRPAIGSSAADDFD